jgi:hypothetical protein
MVSHADGTIIVYDREREDSNFVPKDPGVNPVTSASSVANVLNGTVQNTVDPPPGVSASSSHAERSGSSLGSQSQSGDAYEWNPADDILVTPGPSGPIQNGGVPVSKEKVLRNPISHWRISRKGINGEYIFLHIASIPCDSIETSNSICVRPEPSTCCGGQ